MNPLNDVLRCNVCKFENETTEIRYSLGIYAGKMCKTCWNDSSFRKEGREGFSELDAGEHYEEEDY